MLQVNQLTAGERFYFDGWAESVFVEQIEPMGSFLRVYGESEDGEVVNRLLNPDSCRVFRSDGGERFSVRVPRPEALMRRKRLDLESLEAGMIVGARDRLWRVDGVKSEEKTVRVSSISGVDAEHEFFVPLEELLPASHPPPEVSMVGNPAYQRLLLQALKLDLLHGTAALIGLQKSRVIPMPYQLVPVLMALDIPDVRMLLADDVGLGKTVEAGLIIKELIGRKLAERVLFITPANLREQWKDIMERFFHIDARIISSRHRRKLERELLVGGDPWGHFPFLIASMDYAKQSHILTRIQQNEWDVIVIDEAHNCAKPHQNVPGSPPVMLRWNLADTLADYSKHLLLLTATPHNGYRDTFCSLLQLLDDDMVSGEIPDLNIDRELAKRHVCQRRRRDVLNWIEEGGSEESPLPERDAKELFVPPSSELKSLIDRVNNLSDYIIEAVKGEEQVIQRVARWTVLHFHKRALSSPYALKCSVENRLEKIEDIFESELSDEPHIGVREEDAQRAVLDFDPGEEVSEEEADYRTDRTLFGKALALEKERKLLESILDECEEITLTKDSKLNHLLKNDIPSAFTRGRHLIIFTRYVDTLEYLEKSIREEIEGSLRLRDTEVYIIHGGINPPRRKEIFEAFRRSKRGVLVTTDCMAEGIDLQYGANQIIHYELPWNPNRLEQRNGRIDRFGQPHDTVYIRTLVVEDSLEAAIMENLMRKAHAIRQDYGFAPPFFGDDLAVIDAITEYSDEFKTGPQKSLYEFFETRMDRERKRAERLVKSVMSDEVVEAMQEDSFYGQTSIQLPEVNKRLRETEEALGSSEELKAFVERSLGQFGGSLEPTEYEDVYQLVLSDDLEERYGFRDRKVTFSERKGVEDPSLYVLDLGSSFVQGLVDQVKSMTYLSNELYGRTAAQGSSQVDYVTAIYNIRMRYVVNTEPKGIIEEIQPIGIEFYSDRILDKDEVKKLTSIEPMAHGFSSDEIAETLDEAIQHPKLLPTIQRAARENCDELIEQRQSMRKRLEEDGLSSGLEGFDEVTCASQDIMTLTIYYPKIGG